MALEAHITPDIAPLCELPLATCRPGTVVPAQYRRSPIRAYQFNPFVEALPPIYSEPELLKLLTYDPGWEEKDRVLPAHLRLHQLELALDFVEPLFRHTELAQRISMIMYAALARRNPLARDHWRDLDNATAALREYLAHTPTSGPPNAIPRSIFLVGISGVGKTVGVEDILTLWPQVIDHTEFEGVPFLRRQVVWLKLECPHDGSIRGLCLEFCRQLDELLKTTYYRDFTRNGRATKDEMAVHMARLCGVHGIGLLVIDELQCLCDCSPQESAMMLNFFVQLVNQLRVPMLLIGTYRAQELFRRKARQGRRAILRGQIEWNRIERDEEDWETLLQAMWRYQYLRTPFALNHDFRDALYDVSQGVTHFAVAAYFISQADAIRAGAQTLDIARLRKVASSALAPVQHVIQALRENDVDALAHIEDVQPIDVRTKIRKQARDRIRQQHFAGLDQPATAPTDPTHAPGGPTASAQGEATQEGARESKQTKGRSAAEKRSDTEAKGDIVQTGTVAGVSHREGG